MQFGFSSIQALKRGRLAFSALASPYQLARHRAEWAQALEICASLDRSRLLFLLCLGIVAAGRIAAWAGCAVRTLAITAPACFPSDIEPVTVLLITAANIYSIFCALETSLSALLTEDM
jgi:hypothetical protein